MASRKTSDPVVLITGAAGGLGQGLVSEFATQSWRVVAAHHRPGAVVEKERDWILQLDVTQAEEAGRAVERVLARWGRLDLLINNAGVTADQLSWALTEAEWDRVIDVNLKGAFLC
ncbi:MAG: SDR family NAD(P)-dependent oxidoreductase, partial [Verrucomicrobiota bacterium]